MSIDHLDQILTLDPAIRYVATNRAGVVELAERPNIASPSAASSDRFEELFVNPAIICLTETRGNLDCGGCSHVVIRYGNFWQTIIPLEEGHVSISIEPDADWTRVTGSLLERLPALGFRLRRLP